VEKQPSAKPKKAAAPRKRKSAADADADATTAAPAPKQRRILDLTDAPADTLAAITALATAAGLRIETTPYTPGDTAAAAAAAAAETAPAAKKARTGGSGRGADALENVSLVAVEEDSVGPDGVVEVYDTCDTVRRKIRAMLRRDGVTQAAFLRTIAAAAYGANSGRRIQSKSLSDFLKLKGPLSGNCNTCYYAAYVYFEKLRIKHGKPKSDDRLEMEDLYGHEGGVNITKMSHTQAWFIGTADTRIVQDQYGKYHVR
jgi:hypothetical protein